MIAAKSKARWISGLIATALTATLMHASPAMAAAPSMEISISSESRYLSLNESATITFTASEATTDFTIEDLSVLGGGTFSNFTPAGNGTTYTATYTPSSWATSTIYVWVEAGSFTNGAAEPNTQTLESPIWTDETAPFFWGFYAMNTAGRYLAGQELTIMADLSDNMDLDAYVMVTLNTGAVVRLDVQGTASEMEGYYVIGANDTTTNQPLNVVSYTINSNLKDSYGNIMASTTMPDADNNISASSIIQIGPAVSQVKKNKLKSIPFVAFQNKLNSKGKAAINAYAFAIKEKAGKKIQVTGYAVGANTAEIRGVALARAKAVVSQLKAAGVTGTFVTKGVANKTKRSVYIASSWNE